MSGGSEREVHPDRWRKGVAYAVTLGLLAAFPRLGYPRRWRAPLSPRGVVASVALKTVIGFAARAWVVPHFRRVAQRGAEAQEELRQQLGRTPTEDELLAHLGFGRSPRTTGP